MRWDLRVVVLVVVWLCLVSVVGLALGPQYGGRPHPSFATGNGKDVVRCDGSGDPRVCDYAKPIPLPRDR